MARAGLLFIAVCGLPIEVRAQASRVCRLVARHRGLASQRHVGSSSRTRIEPVSPGQADFLTTATVDFPAYTTGSPDITAFKGSVALAPSAL